jgi:hypothetical protein
MAERHLKYNLDQLQGGIPIERAIQILLAAVNKPDTIFITERWFEPRLKELRERLSDPINDDQAQALLEAVLKQCPFKNVLEWLEFENLSWKDYQNLKRQHEILLEKGSTREFRKERKGSNWGDIAQEISRLRMAGTFVKIPVGAYFDFLEDLELEDLKDEPRNGLAEDAGSAGGGEGL